jgi:hypothetical protein
MKNRNSATPKGIERRLRDARFAEVGDPRRAASVRYPLSAILTALVTAVVTGARSLRQVEQRTLQLVGKLGCFRGVSKRIADNTFGRLLPRLPLWGLLACLHRMVKAEHRRGNLKPTRLPVGTVAIDGKHVATLRWHDLSRILKAEQAKQAEHAEQAKHAEQARQAEHAEQAKQAEHAEHAEQTDDECLEPSAENLAKLRVILDEHYPQAQLCIPDVGEPHVKLRVHTATLVSSGPAVCIHQRPVPGHTNEIGAMPALLDELKAIYNRTRLFGLITTDAGNTSVGVAGQIVALGCDYFCQIKSNHGDLHAEAKRALGRRGKARAAASYTDAQNGEVVSYYLWRIELGEQGWLDWTHARQLVRVQRIAEHPVTGKRSVGNRYYVLSQSSDALGPRGAMTVSRSHWRCENGTHWTADAELMEDRHRQAWSRHPRGVLVASAMRMMALLILAVARHLSRLGYSQERPSWSDVMQHFLLRLCDTILETEAFDDV